MGYQYLSLKEYNGGIHEETNIFRSLFRESIARINGKKLSEHDVDALLAELTFKLSNDDLGRAFYNILLNGINGYRLVDFEDHSRNSFYVVTELTYKNGDDEFRPDIILLVNGMPLSFVEVEKPNNMVFSNNMEYDDTDTEDWDYEEYFT